MVLKVKSSLWLCHQFSTQNPMVHMVLLLVILKVKCYVPQGKILPVTVPSVLSEESFGAYSFLASGSQSQI